MRFLLVTSRSRRMFEGGNSFAIKFIEGLGSPARVRLDTVPTARKGVEFYAIAERPLKSRATRSISKGLSEADRRDLQRLPVLGDGAAGDHDALLTEDFRDLAVRQGSLAILRGDQLLDQGPDRRCGAGTTRFRSDMTSEEILELEDSTRREHELLRRHAGDGRFVQAQRIGDFPQHQRSHADFTVLEEMPLAVDDRLRYAQYRLEALLDVLDQPASLLQLMRQLAARLTTVVLQNVGIHAVDAQLRQRVLIEARHPDVLDLLDDYVGYDVSRFQRGEFRAGTRVEALDQALGLAQLVVSALQRLPESGEIARREKLEMPARDRERGCAARSRFGQGEQLQFEALRAVARAHAGGVEILQVLEGYLQFLELDLQFLGHELSELFQRLRQISVFIKGLDEKRHEVAVARLELGEGQLPVQMLSEVRGIGGYLGVVVFIGVVGGAGAGSALPADPVEVSGVGLGLRLILRAGLLRGVLESGGGLAVDVRRRGRDCWVGIFPLEQRVFREKLLQLLIQFQRGELQQPNRLLKLRRQRQMLRKPEL